jgi:hypothetical protein
VPILRLEDIADSTPRDETPRSRSRRRGQGKQRRKD